MTANDAEYTLFPKATQSTSPCCWKGDGPPLAGMRQVDNVLAFENATSYKASSSVPKDGHRTTLIILVITRQYCERSRTDGRYT